MSQRSENNKRGSEQYRQKCRAERKCHRAGTASASEWHLSSVTCDVSPPPRKIGNRLPARHKAWNNPRPIRKNIWNVRAILVGDGSIGRCGRRLEVGSHYGSSSMNGGHKSFHQIDPRSLRLCEREDEICTWPLRAVSDRAKDVFGRRLEKIDPPLLYKASAPDGKVATYHRMRLWQWCHLFRGVSVLIGGPMARSPSPDIAPYLEKRFGKLARNVENGRNGDCISDAVVNGIDRLLGRKAAAVAARELDQLSGKNMCPSEIQNATTEDLTKQVRLLSSVGQVAPMLHRMSLKVQLKGLPSEIKKSSKSKELSLFSWLAEDARGVWLVRLTQSGVVDHCVAVDTREALILDSAELYPIRLLEEALQMCGGEDSDNPQIAEALQLVEQRPKRSKN